MLPKTLAATVNLKLPNLAQAALAEQGMLTSRTGIQLLRCRSKSCLIEVADYLIRWADEPDGLDPPATNVGL